MFFLFSLFFSIDIFHFPTAVGTEGLFIDCESWVIYKTYFLMAVIRKYY